MKSPTSKIIIMITQEQLPNKLFIGNIAFPHCPDKLIERKSLDHITPHILTNTPTH